MSKKNKEESKRKSRAQRKEVFTYEKGKKVLVTTKTTPSKNSKNESSKTS